MTFLYSNNCLLQHLSRFGFSPQPFASGFFLLKILYRTSTETSIERVIQNPLLSVAQCHQNSALEAAISPVYAASSFNQTCFCSGVANEAQKLFLASCISSARLRSKASALAMKLAFI